MCICVSVHLCIFASVQMCIFECASVHLCICAGGDLVFFIDGLQKAVKEVKKTIGEDISEEEKVGGVAV